MPEASIRTEEISNDQLRVFLEREAVVLSNYSIGFALRTSLDTDASLGGSGTLVTIENERGILTASHVVDLLEDHGEVGLILSGVAQAHHPDLNLQHCRRVAFGPAGQDSGPDLAVLFPPHDLLATLAAKLSFYNLSTRASRIIAKPPKIDLGFWLLSGFAGEWTSDLAPEKGFRRIKSFRGMHGVGLVSKTFDVGGFDYLVFEALYNEAYQGPERFGGFSGGALWHLLVRPVDGDIEVVDRLLSGVAFYQSEKKVACGQTTREVICHGPKSVYGNLLTSVRPGKRSA